LHDFDGLLYDTVNSSGTCVLASCQLFISFISMKRLIFRSLLFEVRLFGGIASAIWERLGLPNFYVYWFEVLVFKKECCPHVGLRCCILLPLLDLVSAFLLPNGVLY